ncbi:MAG: FkbM family methyltransferase [Alphaproteobacteria bacterium]
MGTDRSDRYGNGRARLAAIRRRCAWLLSLRPQFLATPLLKLLSPYERRTIVDVEGMRLYLDPLSHLAGTILRDGSYEAATAALFRCEIAAGDVVLDIGANEGYFAVLAAQLAGPGGTVIAVEPQSRLLDVLRINLALNGGAAAEVFHCAVGTGGGDVEISLTPVSNTGASSIVRRYRWSTESERVPVCSVEAILAAVGKTRADFVKVDVEGNEAAVIAALQPLLATGRVGKLLIDYHGPILAAAGITAKPLEDDILAAGYELVSREFDGLDGYRLYRRG